MSETSLSGRFRDFLTEEGTRRKVPTGEVKIGLGYISPGSEATYVPLMLRFASHEAAPDKAIASAWQRFGGYESPSVVPAIAEARKVENALEAKRLALRALRTRAPELLQGHEQAPTQALGRTGLIGILYDLGDQLADAGSYDAGFVARVAARTYDILTSPQAAAGAAGEPSSSAA